MGRHQKADQWVKSIHCGLVLRLPALGLSKVQKRRKGAENKFLGFLEPLIPLGLIP